VDEMAGRGGEATQENGGKNNYWREESLAILLSGRKFGDMAGRLRTTLPPPATWRLAADGTAACGCVRLGRCRKFRTCDLEGIRSNPQECIDTVASLRSHRYFPKPSSRLSFPRGG